MKVFMINSYNYGSTGNIMRQLQKKVIEYGGEAVVSYPKSRSNLERYKDGDILIGNRVERNFHLFAAYITGFNGCFSIFSTIKLIRQINKYNPDIMHLHNLHNCYINLPILFRYIKKNKIKVIWTLHDCWAFTGQCAHFILAGCQKWKYGCSNCTQVHKYPESLVDQTKIMWKIKKKWFSGVEQMLVVTPSNWLKSMVEQSFLKDYRIEVINNGIDLSIFTPIPVDNEFLKKIGGINKHIILGVSFGWSYEKGLDVFCELAEKMDDSYLIVLVGTNNEIDKKLPKKIVSIHQTKNQRELAKIYSCSDVFVNASRQENYPTVNMEAASCGTPVITFNSGGSSETILTGFGKVIEPSIDDLIKCIREYCENKTINRETCAKEARIFNKEFKFKRYLELYENMNGDI